MSFRKVDKKGAPDWLYERPGKTTTSFWIRYRRDGVRIEKRIEGVIRGWQDARREGQKLLNKEHLGLSDRKKMPAELIRTSDLCRDLVTISLGKSKATNQQTDIFFRLHIIPWVDEHAPYAHDLNASHWDRYKSMKRLENPNITLFNHWKFWVMLFNYAAKQEIVRPTRLEFSEEREDFRERGQLISDEELARILAQANQVWKDRIVLQRATGMRPGEVRCLRKDRVNLASGIISLRKEDTKNRKARAFNVGESVLEVLRRRATSLSPFFFPSRRDLGKPMDRCLTGWENAIKRAGIERHLTPHDLRHTRATELFRSGSAPALNCYILGLSMEEAQKTYLHFKAEDTEAAIKEVTLLTKSLKVVKDSDAW
jgi:integrase